MHKFGRSRTQYEEDVVSAERLVAKLNRGRMEFLRKVAVEEGTKVTRNVLAEPCHGMLIEKELGRKLRRNEVRVLEAFRQVRGFTYALGPDEVMRRLQSHKTKKK